MPPEEAKKLGYVLEGILLARLLLCMLNVDS